MELVHKHFAKGSQYDFNPTAIERYALWATRGDGPALYANPTPVELDFPDEDPRYIVSEFKCY